MVASALRHTLSPRSGILRGLVLAAALLEAVAVSGEQQLEQEPIVIKGDQDLPRTLYIAPWKRIGKPLASGVLDGGVSEPAEPLERDLFLRELELHRQGYSLGNPDSVTIPIRSVPATAE